MSIVLSQSASVSKPMSGQVSNRLARKPLRNIKERIIEAALLLAACVSVLTTIGIVYVLVSESLQFFAHVSVVDFLTDTVWAPMFQDARFGILPLLSATLLTSAVALSVAIPLGTVIAIYLSEFACSKVREMFKPILEMLGGIPTIVFGHFALVALTPFLQQFIPGLPGFNMLSAGLIMGVAIIPYISSLAEDAMRAVPMNIREAAYGMGATKFQAALGVIFPAALSGVLSAYLLAISRAVGETMIVAVAAGGQPNLTVNPTDQGQTISAFIVQVAKGDLPHGSIGYQSIFAAGLSLFILTLLFNVAGHVIRRKFRESY